MVGVAVSPGATVTFQIVDTTNLERVTWEVIGKSANFTSPTITPSGTPSGSTATCTAENTAGVACGIRARGVGPYGTRTLYEGKFYTEGAGGFEAFYAGEIGWAYKLNAWILADPRIVSAETNEAGDQLTLTLSRSAAKIGDTAPWGIGLNSPDSSVLSFVGASGNTITFGVAPSFLNSDTISISQSSTTTSPTSYITAGGMVIQDVAAFPVTNNVPA
jgi:hypothetical protein